MKRLAIVGNGIATNALLTELMALQPNSFEIVVFGDEPQPAYNRVLLSEVLAGEKEDHSIQLQTEQWYESYRITCKLGTRIDSIDHAQRELVCQNGERHPYDALVLATGSKARQLGLPGNDLAGVVAFRSMQDTHYLQSLVGSTAKTVVLGGGLLGLEAAAGLARQGADVTVVHRNTVLMNRQLDAEASRLLQARLEDIGVRFRTGTEPKALLGSTQVQAVELSSGERLDADCVVQAAGIVANAELAKSSGLACHHGVLVDDYLRTDQESVFALGECCEHQGQTIGLVAPIREHAKTLAKVLLGDFSHPYIPSATSALLKVSGIHLFSAGDVRPQSPLAQEISFKAPACAAGGSRSYRKIIIQNRKLTGVVMFGDTSDSPWFLEQLQAETDIEDQRETLIFGRQFCA